MSTVLYVTIRIQVLVSVIIKKRNRQVGKEEWKKKKTGKE